MTEENYGEIARALGVLEGTMRSLMDQWARQDTHATQVRSQMYAKLELLSQQVDRVANDAENIQQDVAEMRNDIDEQVMPTIKRVQAEWERKLGARTVLAIIWGSIGTAGVLLGYGINLFIQYLRSR